GLNSEHKLERLTIIYVVLGVGHAQVEKTNLFTHPAETQPLKVVYLVLQCFRQITVDDFIGRPFSAQHSIGKIDRLGAKRADHSEIVAHHQNSSSIARHISHLPETLLLKLSVADS